MIEGSKILIVEPDEELRDFLDFELTQEGYQVKAVSTGQLALDIAEQYMPDVILLEEVMPEIDGLEIVSRLRTNIILSHIPIILLTEKDVRVDRIC